MGTVTISLLLGSASGAGAKEAVELCIEFADEGIAPERAASVGPVPQPLLDGLVLGLRDRFPPVDAPRQATAPLRLLSVFMTQIFPQVAPSHKGELRATPVLSPAPSFQHRQCADRQQRQ